MSVLRYLLLFIPAVLLSQSQISGVILEDNVDKALMYLPGANVYWLNSEIGTVTDGDGKFVIPYKKENNKLIISHVGFKIDTLTVNFVKEIQHWLIPNSDLDEVTVTSRKQATSKSYLKAQNVYTVSSDELLKAACCNLSESFETNPSIDVNFADAVTGTRQIRMLGLTSPYILITTENIPSIRGAAQAFGLSFIPGTWVESIQITKGAGSVTNGYESIAGQINAELVKPATDKSFFLNTYLSANGRAEINTHINHKINNKWSTGLYLHGNQRTEKFDKNGDSFLDVPLAQQINVLNRWQYTNLEKGLVSFVNLKYLSDSKLAGQLAFNPETDKDSFNAWGSEIETRRYEFATKLGYVNPEIPYKSLGLQTAFSGHRQDSYFGLNSYDIEHNSFYANGVYNSIISDSRHKIKTGLNYTYDFYDEAVKSLYYVRTEHSVGAFFEYNYDNLEKLNLTAGLRVDRHNLLKTFITPRLHVKYTLWEKSALRVSFGRGKRSANIFAENQKLFSTSRNINILDTTGPIYGLNPEIAWNYGISFLQGFTLFGKKGDLALDFYRTDFVNQVVVDYENPRRVSFYNLRGKSIANSSQFEINYNPLSRLDVRLAYKFYEVETQYESGRLQKPLTPKHRFFANASFETNERGINKSQWKFDATFNWISEQRFSSTSLNPIQFQLDDFSPTLGTLNTQITKVFSSKFELYIGGENITNEKQEQPILSTDDAFGSNFDTTFVYGPIFGSSYYGGLRYKMD